MMKKTTASITALVLLLMLVFLPGCSRPASKKAEKTIACSMFPQYDWVLNILGDKAQEYNILLLNKNGTDLHSYQPTVSDIAAAGAADLFIYIGGVSDSWAYDLIKQATNENMISLALIDTVEAKTEEIVEGMQDDDHGHDESGHDEDGDDHEILDEHVWLSLQNAKKSVDAIARALCQIAPENADVFEENAAAYNLKLSELDGKYRTMVASSARKTILFGDRFPFRYLVDDYGLSYYAAFSGCSAETEASFETIRFLAGKVDELSLPVVLKIETSDGKIAQTIIESSSEKNAKILTLNSCQSVTESRISGGASYLSIMEENLEVLRQALN